ncbi:hypothetical protein CTEN210_16288 [Chaetoceros tenuissimus]|uniref:Protein kinase domain-containing protein n=1 Tax=Chaetoceros tenuissimus TaxID=426638 RepID=A0AAD3D9B3_9STRA|nr:hypothetical protein CTEN210_16288 [Chaetoceros tenuissimus]
MSNATNYQHSDYPNPSPIKWEEFDHPEDELKTCSSYAATITFENGQTYHGERIIHVDAIRNNLQSHYGYWLQRSLFEIEYGALWQAQRLECIISSPDQAPIWRPVGPSLRIKVMELIRLAEEGESQFRPSRELSALAHIQKNLTTANSQDGLQNSLEQKIVTHIEALCDDWLKYYVFPEFQNDFLGMDVAHFRFNEDVARNVVRQLITAVESMQRFGVSHRDVCLDNIVNIYGQSVALTDFLQSIKVPYENGRRCLIHYDGRSGHPIYCAPEIAAGDENSSYDGHAVDVWSLGVLIFVLVAGIPPWQFAHDHHDRAFYHISRGSLAEVIANSRFEMSSVLVDLLQNMFHRDPRQRLSLQQVKSHPWIEFSLELDPLEVFEEIAGVDGSLRLGDSMELIGQDEINEASLRLGDSIDMLQEALDLDLESSLNIVQGGFDSLELIEGIAMDENI